MSATTTTHDSRYRLQVVGNPTTAGATAKALAGAAPLMVAGDHVLALMLPDALDRVTHAPAVSISLIDVLSIDATFCALLPGSHQRDAARLAKQT